MYMGFNRFYARLYMRIWLAVAGAVLLAVLLMMLAWHLSTEKQVAAPLKELVLRNADGEQVGVAIATLPRMPGHGAEFTLTLDKGLAAGEPLVLQLPARRAYKQNQSRSSGSFMGPINPPPGSGIPIRSQNSWLDIFIPPYGFVWWMILAGAAVALGAYPLIRRLTSRLEELERGVKKWGNGDLSTRLPVQGRDEVAVLATRFNDAAQQIEQLLLSHKALLANASHELRSPLARIRMGLELLGHNQIGPDVEVHKERMRLEIYRNINELDELVDEILLSSRLDAANADIGQLELVELTEIAKDECHRMPAQLTAEPITIVGSSKLLRRLIRNLIENAHKYAKPQAQSGSEVAQQVEVTLRLEKIEAEDWVTIQVDDNGPGVPEDQRIRIFEPFYRMRGASEKDGGVGLGLALVQSIAKRHGGVAICQERPGGGARFIVKMPLMPLGAEE